MPQHDLQPRLEATLKSPSVLEIVAAEATGFLDDFEGGRIEGAGGRRRVLNISAPFIHRPIATALLMVGLLVGGLVAYPLLPVAALPNVNYPTLQITAQLPGADAPAQAREARPNSRTPAIKRRRRPNRSHRCSSKQK